MCTNFVTGGFLFVPNKIKHSQGYLACNQSRWRMRCIANLCYIYKYAYRIGSGQGGGYLIKILRDIVTLLSCGCSWQNGSMSPR